MKSGYKIVLFVEVRVMNCFVVFFVLVDLVGLNKVGLFMVDGGV